MNAVHDVGDQQRLVQLVLGSLVFFGLFNK